MELDMHLVSGSSIVAVLRSLWGEVSASHTAQQLTQKFFLIVSVVLRHGSAGTAETPLAPCFPGNAEVVCHACAGTRKVPRQVIWVLEVTSVRFVVLCCVGHDSVRQD